VLNLISNHLEVDMALDIVRTVLFAISLSLFVNGDAITIVSIDALSIRKGKGV
jgi:hypothetical protein